MIRKPILFLSLILFVLCYSIPAKSSSDVKPPIRIGMSRPQLEKAFPTHAAEFRTPEPTVTITDFEFHGVKGTATFLFLERNELSLFIWEHHSSKTTSAQSDIKDYAQVFKALEAEYGEAPKKDASEYDSHIELGYWKLPSGTMYTSYIPGTFKVQLSDNNWISTGKQH